ncbi:molybdopterin molybdotransferase MoeA [Catenulispora pinisilvae]|uniref:molybdopterin molybdotransferase MoeA n=1 Tax=Catenulispora pinisilvae TaxID=2705253 RepID=UPI002B277AB9|nr:molybdopterin molybdotransferase MoeA [Catenulispora pinisilvae]
MSTSWAEARKIAGTAAIPLPATRVPMGQARGMVLAESLSALVDLPPFATSAMDGWAVAGPAAWKVTGRVLAGQEPSRLGDGEAVEIATGARVPSGAEAVLRRERGFVDAHGWLHVAENSEAHDRAAAVAAPQRSYAAVANGATAMRTPRGTELGLPIGTDIRPQGQESRRGETLLSAGARVTPAVLGLAAAAGYDDLPVHERPRVALVVIGDELAGSGLPDGARIRDALGPMFTAWLEALGVEVTVSRVADDPRDLLAAIASSPADLVITTGGTARGPVDHVHRVLADLGARLVVDGVTVRPGHPMLLAQYGGTRQHRRFVAGLPGNPLAAVAGFVTVVRPLLRQLSGLPDTSHFLPLGDAVGTHPTDTRLVPVSVTDASVLPLRFTGPAMLRGLALADGLAVVPPGGGVVALGAGQRVEVLTV